MSLATPRMPPVQMDDELTALMLQLEELGFYSGTRKGKHPVGQKPTIDVVYDQFCAELRDYRTFLEDQKIAQSIGEAVHSDSLVIAQISQQEAQANEDYHLALEISRNDPEIETPPSHVDPLDANVQGWMSVLHDGTVAASVTEFSDDEAEAGPSMSYAERQADVLKQFSSELHCCACTERYPRASMITTKCDHKYCIGCIKDLFNRSTHDETLYPPRCCKKPIPLALVAKHMSSKELATFELSAVEYSTQNRIYCSNHQCSRFLLPTSIQEGTNRVVCPNCATATCALCNNAYHTDQDCPEDTAIRQTRQLARDLGWQTCYACNRVVVLRSGCNHMTCHCKAEFCYLCGTRWKNCVCALANEDRLIERAEEIVERDAHPNIPLLERQRRVHLILDDLQENHECEHSRRFERITHGAPRRGFRCEMCDARHHKYILQCRRCHVNVCEECRRNRI